ncbi:hypothetical protein CERSUDRAFT_76901 [Gelatoporia subvermispora B]|uniref:Uncharacterized protein n=1 Tax=Ceriporiopsis subvermispora (strain B) TaxID=914234 RepID=M2R4T4_CERS8|nr:hypothetical protein CERSUDRAFT_76901 [Gelatoporia subvermispora B]
MKLSGRARVSIACTAYWMPFAAALPVLALHDKVLVIFRFCSRVRRDSPVPQAPAVANLDIYPRGNSHRALVGTLVISPLVSGLCRSSRVFSPYVQGRACSPRDLAVLGLKRRAAATRAGAANLAICSVIGQPLGIAFEHRTSDDGRSSAYWLGYAPCAPGAEAGRLHRFLLKSNCDVRIQRRSHPTNLQAREHIKSADSKYAYAATSYVVPVTGVAGSVDLLLATGRTLRQRGHTQCDGRWPRWLATAKLTAHRPWSVACAWEGRIYPLARTTCDKLSVLRAVNTAKATGDVNHKISAQRTTAHHNGNLAR